MLIQNASPRRHGGTRGAPLTDTLTTEDATLTTIKKAIVFISEHILVQFDVSKYV